MTSQPETEIIHIIFTTEDVRSMAEEVFDVGPNLAVESAFEWAKYIQDTATNLIYAQLGSVIETGQP